MGALHHEALYEILLRVPAKPLCRFRAVCRSWRSLLSGPSFAAAHAARRRDQPLLAVCAEPGSSGDRNTAEIRLLDTSGQVVKRFDAGRSSLLRRVWPDLDLVLIVRSFDGGDYRSRPLSVLDFATGAVSLLPGGYDKHDTRFIIRSSFVFGRAPTGPGDHGEYKVLCLNTSPCYNMQFCKILTVDGGSGNRHGKWRDAPAPPVAIETFHWDTLVANGVVYHLVDRSNGWTIAAFDLVAEQWLPDLLHGPAAPLPPVSFVGSRERRNLAEVNGRLAAVYSTDSAMDLWLLMGSGDKVQWCKRCRVLTSSMEWYYWLPADPVPLWVLDDGRVTFWMRSRLASNGTLWMYDPRTETCTHLSLSLKIGASAYTGNLLRQQVQHAHGIEDL